MGRANNVTDLLRPKRHRCYAIVLSDIPHLLGMSLRSIGAGQKGKTESQTYSETVLFLIGRLSVACQYIANNKNFWHIAPARTGKIFRGVGKFILLANSQ